VSDASHGCITDGEMIEGGMDMDGTL